MSQKLKRKLKRARLERAFLADKGQSPRSKSSVKLDGKSYRARRVAGHWQAGCRIEYSNPAILGDMDANMVESRPSATVMRKTGRTLMRHDGHKMNKAVPSNLMVPVVRQS